jgi:hypothetical protein
MGSADDRADDGNGDGEELTAFLRRRIGDGLRSVVAVDGDHREFRYVRADLRAEYGGETVSAILDALARVGEREREGADRYRMGGLGCLVRVFDEGLVFQFTRADGPDLVVAIEPDVAPRLHAFVGECRDRL